MAIKIYEDVPFSGPKYPNLSWTIFFGTNHYYYFHLPIGPFHWAKLKKKILTADPELWGCTILGPKWSICHKQIFFGKIINITLIYLLASPFHCAKFKKNFFLRIQSFEDVQFLDPNWPISPNENFFIKPLNQPCFFHSYLSTYQKSKSDIYLLVKYWRLNNNEISLAENNFCL